MRDCQKIQMARRVFPISLVVAFLVCCPSFAQRQKELSIEDVKAIIRTVIPALEALEAQLPVTGRGTATMETENYLVWLDGKELTVDFVFKGQNSRWDTFEWVGGSKDSRLRARVASDKYGISLVSDDSVTINPARSHDAIRNDFHPTTFVRFLDYPLRRWLQGTLEYDFVADPEQYASAKLDDKGILHIVSGGPVTSPKGEGLSSEYQMSLDTKRGLIPVLLRSTTKRPERTSSGIVRLEWAQYDSVWYVSRVEYSVEPGNLLHRVFKIKNFSPNVEVSDEEFTLNGLNIPDGMLVHDRLAGVSYRYGTHDSHIEDLEKPLEEADFVQKIQAQQPALTSQTVDANAEKQPVDQNQLQSTVDESVQSTRVDDTHADSLWLRRIATACVVALIGVVAFLGYRYFVT